MDYERYISDGNLEKVLLGFATPEEESEYEFYLDIFPELQTEKEEIERKLERLAFKEAALPPAHLKTAIMQQVALEAGVPAITANLYTKRKAVRFEDIVPPAHQMRVHVGWKILLISLLVMIAASILASVIFFAMTIK
ncbi:hypothetical protein [Chitinophaga filiformis]|uniref:Uncharacterized protein n=1 Tax=Chitinophaga filiformis TaxID=104663 RepID=A0A1G7QK15_CHIFI|nr:hypothetical protein [Chitinophaga filiformis]SDF98891.1 hypothetical protein SAMN04488121_10390 [Chitinophaga filiformis]